ncbi:MAG TPA: GIY-YIG nuclease family protein [Allocoleopsis sp.]
MTNNSIKATSAKINLGFAVIDGLMLPSGEYAIAVPQIADLFSIDRNRASTYFKRLMGDDLNLIPVKTSLNRNKINAVSMDNFNRIVLFLAQKGNAQAMSFWNNLYPDLKVNQKRDTKKTLQNGYIYLFEGSNILKLGYSSNVDLRLKVLSRWDGELELVAMKRGNINKEKSLHRTLHLTGDCFGDEWYPSYRKNEILRLMDVIDDSQDDCQDDCQDDLSCNAILEKTLETF